MTACENVCRDFGSWFPSLLSILADLATVAGAALALYAAREWQRWKRQTLLQKAHDVALEALVSLRSFQTHINAARTRPTDTSGFDDAAFEKAFNLLKSAEILRTSIIEKCELIKDLGVDEAASDISKNLPFMQLKISRPLKRANDAHIGGRDSDKWTYLVQFFYSPGAETALDLEIEHGISDLRDCLLRVARIKD